MKIRNPFNGKVIEMNDISNPFWSTRDEEPEEVIVEEEKPKYVNPFPAFILTNKDNDDWLPDLKGTKEEIESAEKIREGRMMDVEQNYKTGWLDKELIDGIKYTDSAKWWIDHENTDFYGLAIQAHLLTYDL